MSVIKKGGSLCLSLSLLSTPWQGRAEFNEEVKK
jgi:hypothetical protein